MMNPKFNIEIIYGDITDLSVDVVVNPSNKWLLAGSGLCGQIYKKAGKEDLEATTRTICENDFGGLVPCGSAVLTGSHGLNCKMLIHVVPPKHLIDPIETLGECYLNALVVADMEGCSSIAFPAIGIGINKIPLHLTFNYISNALKDFNPTTVNKIVFCLNNQSLKDAYDDWNILKADRFE